MVGSILARSDSRRNAVTGSKLPAARRAPLPFNPPQPPSPQNAALLSLDIAPRALPRGRWRSTDHDDQRRLQHKQGGESCEKTWHDD